MAQMQSKSITLAGTWLAAVVGSVFGLGFVIIGFFLGEGPGGGMVGSVYRVMAVGATSALCGILMGIFMAKLLIRRMVGGEDKPVLFVLMSALAIVIASSLAFVVGLEAGFFFGKVTGAISNIEWKPVLLYAPVMGFAYSIPFCLTAGLIQGIITSIFLKWGRNRGKDPSRNA